MSNEAVKLEIIKGVEGRSVYINDYRVAGNKPWGGGTVVDSFETSIKDFLKALDICPVQKISQLEKENAELKFQLDEIKRHIPKIGETLKLTEKDKLIAELKEELARERECVDFYGDQNTYNTDEIGVARIVDAKDVEPEDENTCGFQRYFAGKRARQRIKERKEFE